MSIEATFQSIVNSTNITLVWSFTCVIRHVRLQFHFCRKFSVACWTLVWLVTHMYHPQMSAQINGCVECKVTYITFVVFLTRVNHQMSNQGIPASKCFGTHGAYNTCHLDIVVFAVWIMVVICCLSCFSVIYIVTDSVECFWLAIGRQCLVSCHANTPVREEDYVFFKNMNISN